MRSDSMPRNHELKETILHGTSDFPIQFYIDEFSDFHQKSIPIHWHPEFEFFMVDKGTVSIQIGTQKITLNSGECIFINGNVLHSFQQVDNSLLCRCPNIVFSGNLIASITSTIYQKYLMRIFYTPELPYIVFSPDIIWHARIITTLLHTFCLLAKYGTLGAYEISSYPDVIDFSIDSSCFEMEVQNDMSFIFQMLYTHLQDIPHVPLEKSEQLSQIRMQKMLSFIQSNYRDSISLEFLAASANISRSEAGRCFQTYFNCAPISYLNHFRLERAQELLCSSILTVNEIADACGFGSTSYFIKAFRLETGITPSQFRKKARILL